MNEITITTTDFFTNRNVLVETILRHQEESACVECQWKIAIVGMESLEIIKGIEKPCLLKINIELELVSNAVEVLQNENQFVEDTAYRPKMMGFMGAVLVYCE